MGFDGRSFEDNLKVLQECAREKGDSFFIKITRRNNEGDPMPSQWASLDRGTLEHVVNRELWLEDMIPSDVGGVFELTLFHTSERSRPLVMQGFRLIRDGGRNGGPNCAVIGTKDWRGPPVLIYPRAVNKANEGTVLISSSTTPVSVSAQDAINSSMKGNGNMDKTASNLLDAASQLEKQRMELAEERHRFELTRVEAKATAELNSVKEMMARLEKSVVEARHSSPAERAPNIIEQLPALLAAVSPLIATFTAQSAEREKFLASISEKNAERQAQALKELADSLAKKPDASEGHSKMMLQMSEAMSSIANMTFQAMHQAREVMQAGQQPDQSPWVEVGVKLTEALEKLGTGWMGVLKNRPVIQNTTVVDGQRQLNAPVVTQPQPQPAQQSKPAVRSVATPTGGVAPDAQTQTQPANVLNFPPQPAKTYDNILHPVDKLEAMIRGNEPPMAIVNHFFTHMNTPEMQHELAQVNGEPADLFLARLGVKWIEVEENKAYAVAIGAELVAEAKRRGMMEEEEDEAVEETPNENVATAKPEATNE